MFHQLTWAKDVSQIQLLTALTCMGVGPTIFPWSGEKERLLHGESDG